MKVLQVFYADTLTFEGLKVRESISIITPKLELASTDFAYDTARGIQILI